MAEYKRSDPFYHSRAWKRVRAQAIYRDRGWCCICWERVQRGQQKKARRAELVHHIIPRSERPDLALALSNLQSLCWTCHNREHPEKGRSGGKADQRQPPRSMRIIKV